jgi:hypothetical protein
MLSDLRIVIEKVNGLRVLLWGSKERLGIRAKGRKVFSNNGAYELREPASPYKSDLTLKMEL